MVILGTPKCDQTSMGTDVMCKSSQLVYNYLLICLTLSYVLSGGMAFHRRKHGIEFVCPEKRDPEEQEAHQHFSRKLKADVFIDDRNLGGMLDWGSIYRIIHYRLKIADLVAETLDERLEEAV